MSTTLGSLSLLSPEQAAKILGVKVNTLTVWRCRRTGPSFVRVGSAIRYRAADLDEYVRARTVTIPNAANH